MLCIRLRRTGTRNRPAYRVVVAEARSRRDGRCVEELGHYNPRTSPVTLNLVLDRIDYWVSKGARPSETVSALIRKARKAPLAAAASASSPAEGAEALETSS
jgi:small subunit ribosomal protein S16